MTYGTNRGHSSRNTSHRENMTLKQMLQDETRTTHKAVIPQDTTYKYQPEEDQRLIRNHNNKGLPSGFAHQNQEMLGLVLPKKSPAKLSALKTK